MKRLLALAMSAVMALSLTACTSGTDNSSFRAGTVLLGG